MRVKDLVEQISMQTKLPKKNVKEVIDALVGIIKSSDEVSIPKLGKFVKVKTKEMVKRNPKTGKKVVVPPKIKIKFKLSKAVINELNP